MEKCMEKGLWHLKMEELLLENGKMDKMLKYFKLMVIKINDTFLFPNFIHAFNKVLTLKT